MRVINFCRQNRTNHEYLGAILVVFRARISKSQFVRRLSNSGGQGQIRDDLMVLAHRCLHGLVAFGVRQHRLHEKSAVLKFQTRASHLRIFVNRHRLFMRPSPLDLVRRVNVGVDVERARDIGQ